MSGRVAILFSALLAVLGQLGCQDASQQPVDAAPPPAPPPPLTIPSPVEVEQDLRICLNGRSHQAHIGKERSRLLHRRIKAWPERYVEAIPRVYADMLRENKTPGSHADFCVSVIVRGDEEKEKALHKRIDRARRRAMR